MCLCKHAISVCAGGPLSLPGVVILVETHPVCMSGILIFPDLSSYLDNSFVIPDIRERFHYIILVTICALRNLTEFNWNLGKLPMFSHSSPQS